MKLADHVLEIIERFSVESWGLSVKASDISRMLSKKMRSVYLEDLHYADNMALVSESRQGFEGK